METSSDEEDEEQEDFDEMQDDAAEEATSNAIHDGDEDKEDTGEDDDVDAEGDLEMDEDEEDRVPFGNQRPTQAHAPILRVNPPAAPKTKAKPKSAAASARDLRLKSMETKVMEVDDDGEEDDDEELSDLGSDDEDGEVEEEEDAPGEEDQQEEDEEDEEEEEDEDEDEGEPAGGEAGDEDAEGEEVDEDEEMGEADESHSPDFLSRGTTPDINKMTKRQRSRLNEVLTASDTVGGGGDFLELPMEPQVKKHLTAEEHAMRRAEMARRRKNLSEKRNEEEKQETINRLLKKQAPKRRGKISAKEIEAQDRGDMSEADEQVEEEVPTLPANPIFVRWISNAQGYKVGVPVEWLGSPVGKVFGDTGERNTVEQMRG